MQRDLFGVTLIIFLALLGCDKSQERKVTENAVTCKGVYYDRDSEGNLKKFNQYKINDQCYTDQLPLSHWEKGNEAWAKNNVQCVPQAGFVSRTVISANNFYTYRDGRVLIDLDSSTGTYRKLVLGEDHQGNPTFTRSKACFYQRTATGVDAAYGNQLLLDSDIAKWASTENFETMEIFKYDETATTLNMTRFDSSSDWDYRFCPFLSVPENNFCLLLQDGNDMFFPMLTAQQQADLLAEALLIGKQFNYVTTSKSQFEDLWQNVDKTKREMGRDDWKYKVIHTADVPLNIDGAWRDFLMGKRPTMPNVMSPSLPIICYSGSQAITLANGSAGRIFGEICYINGSYTFKPQ